MTISARSCIASESLSPARNEAPDRPARPGGASSQPWRVSVVFLDPRAARPGICASFRVVGGPAWPACRSKLPSRPRTGCSTSTIPASATRRSSWSRYLSLYQTGYGARGIGFRDSSQDVHGRAGQRAGRGGKLSCGTLLGVQRRDGFAMHQFNPATREGSMGDALERDDRPHYYSDDHLWSILAVAELAEGNGGPARFSMKSIPSTRRTRNGSPAGKRDGAGAPAARNRVHAGQRRARTACRSWGLRTGTTRSISQPGAESMFTANLYGKALQEMIEHGPPPRGDRGAEEADGCYDEMKERFLAHAWDGQWWLRYFDWDGTPLGSRVTMRRAGSISTGSRGRCSPALPRRTGPDRGLESVHRMLNTRNGIKIIDPRLRRLRSAQGRDHHLSARRQGKRRHLSPHQSLGDHRRDDDGQRRPRLRVLPPDRPESIKNDRIDEYECEPYVYPQNILGDEHPQFGLARNSWLSGTASWVYQAATKHILGLRPTLRGLLVESLHPVRVGRVPRGAPVPGRRLQVEVRNPSHVCRGVASVSVDGARHEGALLPVFADGRDASRSTVILGTGMILADWAGRPYGPQPLSSTAVLSVFLSSWRVRASRGRSQDRQQVHHFQGLVRPPDPVLVVAWPAPRRQKRCGRSEAMDSHTATALSHSRRLL